MIDIPCVIFAGGRSSRMGEDKALLPFGDSDTLTQFQLSRLEKIFKMVYISTKSKEKFNFDAKFILDAKTDGVFAPTAGFVGVFETLQEDSFFAISVDAPFVCENEIAELMKHDDKEHDATIAKTEFGIQPMCGIYHRSLEADFKEMLKTDNHKLGLLLRSSEVKYVMFKNEQAFYNINNQKEYKDALQVL